MANELHDLTPPFPDQLRTFIAAKKLTQSAFQKRYSISETSLKRLLNGQLDRTRASTLAKIAKIMKDKKWPVYLPTAAVPVTDDTPAPAPVRIPVDFRKFISNADYVPRNLILFVTRYPDAMPQEERDAWKGLFEGRLQSFTGLVSGHEVGYDEVTETFVARSVEQRPEMTVRESFGKPVREMLKLYYQKYVKGRRAAEIMADSLSILAVEPDATGTLVVEAWSIDGIVFSNTGCLPASRNINAAPAEVPPHAVKLYSKVSQNTAVSEQAKLQLAKLNSPVCKLG